MSSNRGLPFNLIAGFAIALLAMSAAWAQDRGPFAAHQGLRISTAFTSSFGPDAESTTTFTEVGPQGVRLNYISSRGVHSTRQISAKDSQSAMTLVLGYADKMPETIPDSTTVGFSTAVLEALRSTGAADVRLVYDASLQTINGTIRQQEQLRFPVMIENQVVELPAVRVTGEFGTGTKQGRGEFIVYDDRNSPALLQYSLQFSWESAPRSERVVRVTAGASERQQMETTLRAYEAYETYGIHFDFDKASMQPQSQPLIADIAETLRVNPGWRLMISGHTDSIGGEDYNLKLSQARAESVKTALVKEHGVDPGRLETQGLGMSNPKASNETLQGRKLNRRVELKRTDR